jgi:hypothetical protein
MIRKITGNSNDNMNMSATIVERLVGRGTGLSLNDDRAFQMTLKQRNNVFFSSHSETDYTGGRPSALRAYAVCSMISQYYGNIPTGSSKRHQKYACPPSDYILRNKTSFMRRIKPQSSTKSNAEVE